MLRKLIISMFVLLFAMNFNAQTKKKKVIKKVTKKTVVVKKKIIPATVKSTFPSEKPAADIMRLKEGETIFNKEGQFNVTFLRVIQDSRCPMNARCIVAGNATVELEVMSVHSRPMKIQLCTEETPSAKKTMNVFESVVTLENIYPATSTDVPFERMKGNYIIDLKVNPTN